MERAISVLIVAAHDTMREALAGLLTRQVATGDVLATGNRAEAIATAARQRPDLIVVDTHRFTDWRDFCHDLHAASDGSKLAVLHGDLPGKQDGPPLLPATHLDKSTRATELVQALLRVASVETVVCQSHRVIAM